MAAGFVQNREGYGNLLKLLSALSLGTEARLGAELQLEDLEAFAGGLIALAGALDGPVGRALRAAIAAAPKACSRNSRNSFPVGCTSR